MKMFKKTRMYYITQNTFMNSKCDFYNMYTHSGNR